MYNKILLASFLRYVEQSLYTRGGPRIQDSIRLILRSKHQGRKSINKSLRPPRGDHICLGIRSKDKHTGAEV